MKFKFIYTIQLLYFINFSITFAQHSHNVTSEQGIGNYIWTNDSKSPCISPAEYEMLENECAENIRNLGLDKSLKRSTVSLAWPIKAATGFTDCDIYFIGAYVDQDTSKGTFKDFDCGSNTYDGHHGTDISVWPYGFYKMDNSQVEVVAAAAGTIVQKADGNFDRNCASNILIANSIILQHADGSCTLYWHMKKNSVTTKNVGQTVVAGEYLGVAGSSGNSSGPHLHFEVWAGSLNTTYNDPYSGTCNSLNSSSWWNLQKPAVNPAVIKVSVNTTDIVIPGCPTTETPNEGNSFAIPFQGTGLAPGYAKFYIFIRDDASGLSADCKILNPNGSTFNSWTYTSIANSKTLIKGYSKILPTLPGTYTFQATYNGNTCSKIFTITTATVISKVNDLNKIRVFPNSLYAELNISGENIENGNYEFTLTNILGQVVSHETSIVKNNYIQQNFSIGELSNGIYYLSIECEKIRVIQKLVIQN